MQNKANFKKSQMNVTNLLKRDYDQMDTWSIRKNEPKTNPNEPKVKIGKMNVTTFLTMNYEQRTMNYEIKNKPNSKPIQTQFKAKTNPIQSQYKPKQTQFELNFPVPNIQIYPISHQRTMNNEQRTNNKQTQFQTLSGKNGPHDLKNVDRLAELTLNLKIRKDLFSL